MKFRFKSIAAKKQQGIFLGWFLVVFVVPILLWWKMQERIFLYMMLIGPIAYANLNERIHMNIFSKTFYLCPMCRAERKAYIEKTFQFRMMIPVFLGIPGIIIVGVAGYCDWICAVIMLFQLIIVSYLCADYLVRTSQFIGVIFAWTCMLMNYSSIFDSSFESWRIKRVLSVFMVLTEVFIFFYCRKGRLERIEKACNYEGGGVCRLQFSLRELWQYMNRL